MHVVNNVVPILKTNDNTAVPKYNIGGSPKLPRFADTRRPRHAARANRPIRKTKSSNKTRITDDRPARTQRTSRMKQLDRNAGVV